MRGNQFLKGKSSILELEKDLKKLKDGELKDRSLKTKREIEELFLKLIIASVDDIYKHLVWLIN